MEEPLVPRLELPFFRDAVKPLGSSGRDKIKDISVLVLSSAGNCIWTV